MSLCAVLAFVARLQIQRIGRGGNLKAQAFELPQAVGRFKLARGVGRVAGTGIR